jgi:hypothetical protein
MSDPKDIMHMGAVMQLTGHETVTSKALLCSELTPAQLKDTGDIFLQHHQLCIENTQLREQLRATQAELKSLCGVKSYDEINDAFYSVDQDKEWLVEHVVEHTYAKKAAMNYVDREKQFKPAAHPGAACIDEE